MTPIENLTAKINEAFPERLKLEFGCELGLGNELFAVIVDVYTDTKGEDWNYKLRQVRNGEMFFERRKSEMDRYKILGRPIELADVLRAIDHGDNQRLDLDTVGKLLLIPREQNDEQSDDANIVIDLALPVSQWPDSTINAILELL